MIPKYFRSLDPTGKCPLAVSKEIVKETSNTACPCGDANCLAEREYVGLIEGISNGRSKLVYTLAGVAGVLTLLILLLVGGNKVKQTIAGFEERLVPLQTELEKLESQSKGSSQTKGRPVDLKGVENSVIDLQRSADQAIASKDATQVAQVRTKVLARFASLQSMASTVGAPQSGSGALVVNAKGLAQKFDDLRDDSESILAEMMARHPADAPLCDDFLSNVDDGQKRVRRLIANVSSETNSSETKGIKAALDRNLKKLETVRANLDRFSPPPPMPFESDDADLVILAAGDNAGDLAAPLVAGWSGGTVIPGSDGAFYISGGSKGKLIVRPVTPDEGFAALADGKAAIFFSDQSPDASELGRIGSGIQENRSVAEVVALDAMTLLVNPTNSVSQIVVAEKLPLRVEAGDESSNVRRKAEHFEFPLVGSGISSGEESALKNSDAISLGLYHKEGVNIRAKRLAVRATQQTAALKPSPFAIATEDYLYSFRIVAWTPPNAAASAMALVKFATSNEGQEIISKQGYVDLRLTGSQEEVPPEILAALGSAMGSKTVSSAIRISTNIRFETGKAHLDLKAQADIERLPQFAFEKYPSYKVVILGFTDGDGGHEINMPLSKERASVVAQELRRSKVDATSSGLGSMFPVDSNETYAGKAKNRRAEVWVARP